MFHCLFMHLEEISLLDINNVVYMIALHYVYKPPINSGLKAFWESWDFRPLSTEGNRTPHQLWVEGLLKHYPVQPKLDDAGNWSNYGIDWEGKFPFSAMDIVELPKIKIDHKSEILTCSSEPLNPLLESSVYGIETFVQCIDMIATLLSTFGD